MKKTQWHLRNSHDEYGLISRYLHWMIAMSMIGLIAIGWYMSGLSDESVLYWRLLDFHQTFGIVIFILFLVKVIWMMSSPYPDFIFDVKPWERHTARFVHAFFMIVLVIIPLSGFLYAASNGEPVNIYDLFEIPDLGKFSKSTRDILFDIHMYTAYCCAAFIALHVSAAFKHYFKIYQ